MTFPLATLVVVETDDDRYLGTVEIVDAEHIKVHSGMRGRRPRIRIEDVVDVTLATEHSGVLDA